MIIPFTARAAGDVPRINTTDILNARFSNHAPLNVLQITDAGLGHLRALRHIVDTRDMERWVFNSLADRIIDARRAQSRAPNLALTYPKIAEGGS